MALPQILGLLSLILSGAIFGFFYAWVCSTMWGLDTANPEIAIPAMQAMNASVRNAVFAPAFFATPFVMLITAYAAHRSGAGTAMTAFAAGGLIYLVGGVILTLAVNVPMNEALAQVTPDEISANGAAIWAEYSPRWQRWNVIRTIASGVALLLAGIGLLTLPRGA
ncbi:DUF1772 domain-containing protein [Paracoccaceae bacterium GXU_MW_L88]